MERKTRKTRKSLKLCQPERFIWWQLIIKFGYSKNWNPVCGKTTGPCLPLPQFSHEGHSSLRLGLKFDLCIPHVGKTRINHPFENGFIPPIYGGLGDSLWQCFTHIIPNCYAC